jgi:formylglycine-generating enzyme required for sulfatase activity
MGDLDAGIDAQPPHEVTISAFNIDRTEVTYEQFRDFLVANPEWQRENVDPTLADDSYLNDWSGVEYPAHLKDHPMRWVSWHAATAYAEWRGARLPTEAEWELAARGTGGRPWPWGWEAPDSTTRSLCNYRAEPPESDGFLVTAPVGSCPDGDSPFGALDMAGNVWEWTADWHDPEYYAESPSIDPRGPNRGTYRVLRGGSWSVPALWTRSTVRLRAYPTRCSDQVGFRCVRDIGDGE